MAKKGSVRRMDSSMPKEDNAKLDLADIMEKRARTLQEIYRINQNRA